jgi:hypothetical protein
VALWVAENLLRYDKRDFAVFTNQWIFYNIFSYLDYKTVFKFNWRRQLVAVVARSTAWNILGRSNTAIVVPNPTRMDFRLRLFCICVVPVLVASFRQADRPSKKFYRPSLRLKFLKKESNYFFNRKCQRAKSVKEEEEMMVKSVRAFNNRHLAIEFRSRSL